MMKIIGFIWSFFIWLFKKALDKWKKVTFPEKMKKMTFFSKFGIR
jgi:hypothetical protein